MFEVQFIFPDKSCLYKNVHAIPCTGDTIQWFKRVGDVHLEYRYTVASVVHVWDERTTDPNVYETKDYIEIKLLPIKGFL